MPKKIDAWMRVRELADPDLKTLIEKQIISTAHRVLGDFHNKILLSLPPERKAKGVFDLGTVLYDGEKWPFGISSTELTQNMAIFGDPGQERPTCPFISSVRLLLERFLLYSSTGNGQFGI